MDRLVRDDRKTTVTQITTRYNQDLQKIVKPLPGLMSLDFCCNIQMGQDLV